MTHPTYIRPLGLLIGAFAALLLATSASAAIYQFAGVDATKTIKQSFHVQGIPNIEVNDAVGSLAVSVGGGETVSVIERINAHGLSRSLVQSDMNADAFTATQTSNGVTVAMHDTGMASGTNICFVYCYRAAEISFEIQVPPQTNLTLLASVGSVSIQGIVGQFHITSSVGSVNLDDVGFAGVSNIDVSVGSLNLRGHFADPAAQVNVTTSVGSVNMTVPADTPAHVEARSSLGSVNVDRIWTFGGTHSGPSASVSGDMVSNPTGRIVINSDLGSITLSAG